MSLFTDGTVEPMTPLKDPGGIYHTAMTQLEYLMFLEEMRCGKIKGCGCANGKKQWKNTSKHKKSAPTVVTEALLLSCVIDAKEGQDVAACNIPGAFMQADMDKLVHVKFEGVMLDALVKLNPKLYRLHALVERGR